MPTILAINPNTSEPVTALLERHLLAAAPRVVWRMATGKFGASYIASEASFAASLDSWDGNRC